MKKLSFLLLGILLVIGCSKKSDNSSSYSNSLQLGTGISSSNLFQLTGTGTSFAAESTIWFRLESSDDMEGSQVKIQIDKQDGTSYTSFPFDNPQSYGHIFLSNFVIGDPGSYKATGILVKTSKTIASVNFTVYVTK